MTKKRECPTSKTTLRIDKDLYLAVRIKLLQMNVKMNTWVEEQFRKLVESSSDGK